MQKTLLNAKDKEFSFFVEKKFGRLKRTCFKFKSLYKLLAHAFSFALVQICAITLPPWAVHRDFQCFLSVNLQMKSCEHQNAQNLKKQISTLNLSETNFFSCFELGKLQHQDEWISQLYKKFTAMVYEKVRYGRKDRRQIRD